MDWLRKKPFGDTIKQQVACLGVAGAPQRSLELRYHLGSRMNVGVFRIINIGHQTTGFGHLSNRRAEMTVVSPWVLRLRDTGLGVEQRAAVACGVEESAVKCSAVA